MIHAIGPAADTIRVSMPLVELVAIAGIALVVGVILGVIIGWKR